MAMPMNAITMSGWLDKRGGQDANKGWKKRWCILRDNIIQYYKNDSEVSLQDVRKEINFCRKVNLPIIGVVENMSGFVCPKCKNRSEIFPPTTGGAAKMAADMGVPFLGHLPLDPRIGKCCDEGKSFLSEIPDSPAAKAYRDIIHKIVEKCSQDCPQNTDREDS